MIVAERCLNHSLGGLLSIYDQHDYLTERRAALERWTDFLVGCGAGSCQLSRSARPRPIDDPRPRCIAGRRLRQARKAEEVADTGCRCSSADGESGKSLVATADVLQLGLDERLVLSVRFSVAGAVAAQLAAHLPGEPKADRRQARTQAGERRTTTQAEIWDLPLIGSERASVEARCQAAGWELCSLSRFHALPAFVRSRMAILWQLPSRGLPPDCEIVIRTEALASLEGESKCSHSQDRERISGDAGKGLQC